MLVNPYMKRFVTILCLLAAVLLSGCNLIYKQTIQQGNALEADDLQQLKVGMSKRQVSLILGTPAIHDPFHLNRWDYVYTFRPRGREGIQRIITLSFDDGQLVAIEGDIDDILLQEDLVDSQDDETQEGPADTLTAAADASAAVPAVPQAELPMPATGVTEPATAEASAALWTVQLGMFEHPENAAAMVDKLTTQDIQAWSEPVAESANTLIRVLAGKYADQDQADALRAQISEQMGIEGLLARLPE